MSRSTHVTAGEPDAQRVFRLFIPRASLFFVHHTAGNECHDFNSCASTLRGIQNYHMDTRGNKNEGNLKERGA